MAYITRLDLVLKMNRKKCPWCGTILADNFAEQSSSKFSRYICSGCGSIGYINLPSSVDLQSVYKNAWVNANTVGRFAAGATSEETASSLIKIANISQKDTCLDYGGGKGKFAKALIRYGVKFVHVIEPFGPDPSINGVIWHQSLSNLPNGLLYDKIFMIEVVEHLLTPVSVLHELKKRLNSNGWLFITTPNALGWRARLQKTEWREARNLTHINLFSFRALSICLHRAGYSEIHRINRPIKYGKNGLRSLVLNLTQLLGIDGGLKVMAR